jgi:tetratricopeptide (TPR) repeat protein
MRLAAILIVKGTDDEAPHLKRCLENIMPHVDHVFLNINTPKDVEVSKKLMKVVKFYQPKYLTYMTSVWQGHFAQARNQNLDMVSEDYDWIIWLDTDDTVDKPGKIRKVAEVSAGYDAVFVDYLYDYDEEMNPEMVHLVARLFKNNGSHRWKGRIHETLIETRGVSQGATKDFIVIHHADGQRTQSSFERNIGLLEAQLEDEKKSPDPRTFFYLASVLMDAGQPDRAFAMFSDYLQLSGWDQERSVALTKMGRILLDKGDRTGAKECFARAVAEDPVNPDPRVELGSLEVELQRYDKAITWLEYVEKMEKNLTTLERNPMTYTFRTFILLAESYLNLGGKHLDKAVEYGKKALKYKRKDKNVKAWVKMIQSVAHDRELTKNMLSVYKELKKGKETDKLKLLIEAVPKNLEDNPVFVRLRDQDSFSWPDKSIAIMTGDTMIDAWGPWSLSEGIGGSEEAIIRLAPKLAKQGYQVVVFGKPGAPIFDDDGNQVKGPGLIDGVMWRNYWEWNPEDKYDVFIGWRGPYLFDREIKANRKYLWLHDVMEPGEFTTTRLANLDKVIVLSKYHRSLFPMISDDKIMLSGNGIDPEDFEWQKKLRPKRDPHKVFYGSSHVRGLAYLYEVWPDVLKAVPDATLDVYYGRESYDAVHKGNPERLKWMDDMMMKAKTLKGVTDHGKVDQTTINQAIFRSGVWAYPCPFPEIYCITAIKAQAGGAIPVSSNFAALDETVQFGIKLHMAEQKEGAQIGLGDTKFLNQFRSELIKMLQNQKLQDTVRPRMMKWAREQSWDKIAKQWVSDIENAHPVG